MKRRRLIAVAAMMAVTTATLSFSIPATASRNGIPSARFPLGVPGIPTSTFKALGPGIEYFTVKHGTATEGYTVSVLVAGKDYMSEAKAEEQALAVQDAGFDPVIVKFTRPAVADYPAADLWMVRIGGWTLKEKADAAEVVSDLKSAGVTAKVDYLGDDGFQTTGPWQMRVITVDPRSFHGSFASSLGTSVAKREKVSAMAKSAGALAAVNGGFFDIHTIAALRGDPTGISVVKGELLSEAVAGRVGLVLRGRTARVTELSSTVRVHSPDGARAFVTGLNRIAKPDELIMYTDEFGAKTPADEGAEAVLDAAGKVIAVRSPGAAVPKGARVLHGNGLAADWIFNHAWEGWTLQIKTSVADLRTKKNIPLTPETYIIGGAIQLVRGGKTSIRASRDGMANVNMILRRHPRTLAGVTRAGKLVIAVIDGRGPGTTVGASFIEAAQVMRWLGARDAVNLDGGGSSAMVIGKKVVNRPSDGVERGVGDALLILP